MGEMAVGEMAVGVGEMVDTHHPMENGGWWRSGGGDGNQVLINDAAPV